MNPSQNPTLGVDPKEIQLTIQFLEILNQFLQSLSKTFPKCKKLANKKIQFDVAIKTPLLHPILVKTWYTQMKPFMAQIHEGKVEEIINLPDEKLPELFTEIAFRGKWNRLRADDGDLQKGIPSSKEQVLEFIVKLNSLSSMQTALPEKMRKAMETVAVSLSKDHSINSSAPTREQLLQGGHAVVKSIKKQDFSNFLDSAPDMFDDMGGMSRLGQIFPQEKILKNAKGLLANIKSNPAFKSAIISDVSKMNSKIEGDDKSKEPDYLKPSKLKEFCENLEDEIDFDSLTKDTTNDKPPKTTTTSNPKDQPYKSKNRLFYE